MENTKDIKRLEVTLALLLPSISLIMRMLDGYFRTSISDCAYSDYNYVYVFMLTLAGTMFIYNGLGYKRHWYNFILGVSLYGVALTPHLNYPIWHDFFAGTFFIGNILAIGLSSNLYLRNWKYLVAAIASFGLFLHFKYGIFCLGVAETIGIIPFSFAFITKNIKK